MPETKRCSIQGCEEPAAASLEVCSFCRGHFIFTCYERLDRCRDWQEGRLSGDRTARSVQQFLVECSLKVANLVLDLKEFNRLERAQLLDILLQATNLSCHLRQNPRLAASIPVELRSEEPSGAWGEQTRARSLSHHGALLECQHPVRAGEILLVVRMDSGRQAQARVAWRRRKLGGPQEIGIEFLDCENFWDLDCSSAEPVV